MLEEFGTVCFFPEGMMQDVHHLQTFQTLQQPIRPVLRDMTRRSSPFLLKINHSFGSVAEKSHPFRRPALSSQPSWQALVLLQQWLCLWRKKSGMKSLFHPTLRLSLCSQFLFFHLLSSRFFGERKSSVVNFMDFQKLSQKNVNSLYPVTGSCDFVTYIIVWCGDKQLLAGHFMHSDMGCLATGM